MSGPAEGEGVQFGASGPAGDRPIDDRLYTDFDGEYTALLRKILESGENAIKPSRQIDPATGKKSWTFSLTAQQIRIKLPAPEDQGDEIVYPNFPKLFFKHLPLEQVAKELAWFLRGGTNSLDLEARGCSIWKADADKATFRGHELPPGELGPIYGWQWRKHPGYDQIDRAIETLTSNPFARDNVVSAWDVERLGEMVLKPCHYSFQFVCRKSGDTILVDCVVTMRSTDVGLGLPFNVASYALLTILCALEASEITETAYHPGELIVNMADCHVYGNHVEYLQERLDEFCGSGRMLKAVYALKLPKKMASISTFASATTQQIEAAFKDKRRWAPFVKLPLLT